MKTLSILGSTGSIGRNACRIVSKFNEQFRIKALTAHSNLDLLAEQVRAFHPEVAAVYHADDAKKLKDRLPSGDAIKILAGREGYLAAATLDGVDMVVGAMVGAAGLDPILAAIQAGKDIALANKETLVMAGALVMAAVAENNVQLLPVDSEHSAIFQALQGQQRAALQKILLTASGGPFLDTAAADFETIGPADALKHPNWQMGTKITIDSASLMNKGLEVIEAKWLFDLDPQQIEVVVHPQSIVHSMVAFQDGAIIAQLGIPDMQGAIAYALSFPQRLPLDLALPDLTTIDGLTFRPPDLKRFGCLKLAYDALELGGTAPAVLNAANEMTVAAFLAGKIGFPAIYHINHSVLEAHQPIGSAALEDILEADRWARRKAQIAVDKRPKV